MGDHMTPKGHQKGHGTTAPAWIEVSCAEQCPICGEPDLCWRSRDGRVVNCATAQK